MAIFESEMLKSKKIFFAKIPYFCLSMHRHVKRPKEGGGGSYNKKIEKKDTMSTLRVWSSSPRVWSSALRVLIAPKISCYYWRRGEGNFRAIPPPPKA